MGVPLSVHMVSADFIGIAWSALLWCSLLELLRSVKDTSVSLWTDIGQCERTHARFELRPRTTLLKTDSHSCLFVRCCCFAVVVDKNSASVATQFHCSHLPFFFSPFFFFFSRNKNKKNPLPWEFHVDYNTVLLLTSAPFLWATKR